MTGRSPRTSVIQSLKWRKVIERSAPECREVFLFAMTCDLPNPERKSSLNIKFLGGIFLGHAGPRLRDIPDKKLYASGLCLLL